MLDTGRLDRITTFPALIDYLRDELDWPIEEYNFDELTYDWDPKEFGLSGEGASQIEIKQLRPIEREPWGIFFLSLPHKKLPITVLRRLLGGLAVKKRASANAAERAAWNKDDLLFIAAHGAGDERGLAFAHFHEDADSGDLPTLKVLGWDEADTIRRLSHTHSTLKGQLHWAERGEDDAHWRARWNEAFREKPGEVIATSKALAKELARLAREIRRRANELLAEESDSGPLRTLHKAFKEALIHDLKHDDFADMYAQTIAYGLLSAAISRESGALIADDVAHMAPATNPFLKDLLQTFLSAGGRKGGMDFDELGVNDVVEMLRRADMHSVLLDFDTKNPSEDPVIHFYELFLKEYDAKKRMQRGVFYTPRPVVSFIVRSVDEVLRTEFGLEDGLASTATWGEVIEASKTPLPLAGGAGGGPVNSGGAAGNMPSPDPSREREGKARAITLPANTALTDPFVRILDPATGTGTFLVEVVDLIHGRMTEKWRKAGKSAEDIEALWNDYVPKHLLPRLYGFELMMAPYAIAHMKLGLKLAETNYHFRSDERARIYLTNALEPAQDFDMQLAFMSQALAHEAQAANRAKEVRFTAVVGNPPYAGMSSNMSEAAQSLVTRYRFIGDQPLGERKIWVQNDYVKFLALAEGKASASGTCVLGFITDNSYTDGPTFRGVRHSLQATYPRHFLADLGGKSTALREDARDENVFDIQQGVAVFIGCCLGVQSYSLTARVRGSRSAKHGVLLSNTAASLAVIQGYPRPDLYDFFAPPPVETEEEYKAFEKLSQVFDLVCTGVQTSRDHLAVAFTKTELSSMIDDFARKDITDDAARLKYFGESKEGKLPAGDTRQWKLPQVRSSLRTNLGWRNTVLPIIYRPFDERTFCADERLSDWPRPELTNALGLEGNIALMTVRRTENEGPYAYFFATNQALSNHSLSSKDGTYGMPLHKESDVLNHGRRSNFNERYLSALGAATGLETADASANRGDLQKTFGPRDVFDWIYAALHSPSYRARYADYLKSDFARIPLPGSKDLFQELVPLGTKLVALHLLDAGAAPELKDPQSVRFAGHGEARVEKKPEWSAAGGNRVTISAHRWFEGVPERVWTFHIGGYQPAQKWLKDRAAKGGKKKSSGRILTAEDQLHYRRMIVAMDKTIDLMAEIDLVIDKHGGWPGAFRGMSETKNGENN